MTTEEIIKAYSDSKQVKELIEQLSSGDDRKDFFLQLVYVRCGLKPSGFQRKFYFAVFATTAFRGF